MCGRGLGVERPGSLVVAMSANCVKLLKETMWLSPNQVPRCRDGGSLVVVGFRERVTKRNSTSLLWVCVDCDGGGWTKTWEYLNLSRGKVGSRLYSLDGLASQGFRLVVNTILRKSTFITIPSSSLTPLISSTPLSLPPLRVSLLPSILLLLPLSLTSLPSPLSAPLPFFLPPSVLTF